MNNTQTNDLLTRTVAEIIDQKHLEQQLQTGKKLRIKLGIDPTSPNIHIGRAVALWKLREFQDLGHQAVLIVGDFTGQIGDTSDKDSERPMLDEKTVQANMKTYFEQAFKILDPKKTETHYNSEWLKKLGLLELGRIAQKFSLHEVISRELIKKRLDANKTVSLQELFYPLMQGYDSVAVKADVELGGVDQRFNLLAGRVIQPLYDQQPQDLVITKFPLPGLDGRKMSSSWDNGINLTDEPNDMFGKVMSLQDELIGTYLEMATRLPISEIEILTKQAKTKPREIKMRLAAEIVALYHGPKAAKTASDEWVKVFSNKEKPSEIEEMKIKSKNIVDVLVETKLVASKSEAKRLIEQKGVKIDDEAAEETSEVESGNLIQVGKRKFIRIK